MQLGISLPTANVPNASAQAIVRIAQAAEDLGYNSVWTYERLLYPTGEVAQPGGSSGPLPDIYKAAYDPIDTLAFVAASTQRIRLGTSVVDALFHAPVVLAKRFATLDQVSCGRAIAGLGQGWMDQEFATANIPTSRRGAGLDELVAAMRAVWGPDPVSYAGRFYRVPESLINPKPVQAGGPPILLGSLTLRGVQRAARIADGLNPVASSSEQLSAAITAFRDAAQAIGRDASRLEIQVRVNTPISAEPLPAGRRPYLGGSAEQIVGDLLELQTLRIDGVFFATGFAASLGDEEQRMAELMRAASAAGVVDARGAVAV